jgi:hypothetical protein
MPFLSADECKLPLAEIEALLRAQRMPKGTKLYQAHYYPTFMTYCTISALITPEFSTISLYIWDTPLAVERSIANNLHRSSPTPPADADLDNQPKFIEEHAELSRYLVQYLENKMKQLNVINLPATSESKYARDGLSVNADIIFLNRDKNHIEGGLSIDAGWRYYWELCHLGMRCMEEKRSLKYLIALTDWLMDYREPIP